MERYVVVHYPTYWVVIDRSRQDAVVAGLPGQHPIVYESRSQNAAHTVCARLNRENQKMKEAT
jgi:hypothetical protein